MRKGWDEEWYPMGISTEAGQKKLIEKKKKGVKVFIHDHPYSKPCDCRDEAAPLLDM